MSKKLLFSQDKACMMVWTIRINTMVEVYHTNISAAKAAEMAEELSKDYPDVTVDICTGTWVRRTYLDGEIIHDVESICSVATDHAHVNAMSIAKWHNL